jgi:hypothetical protein
VEGDGGDGGGVKPRGQLPTLERVALDHWLANASHVHYGLCDDCRRHRDDDERPLLVARQERSRRFRCLRCWEGLA